MATVESAMKDFSHPITKIFDKKIGKTPGWHFARKRLTKNNVIGVRRFISSRGDSLDIFFMVDKFIVASIYYIQGAKKNYYGHDGARISSEQFVDELRNHPQFTTWLLWNNLL